MNDAVVLAVVGALGGLVTLVATRWKARGEWTDKELRDVRQDLRVRIRELEDRETARDAEMRELLQENGRLRRLVEQLTERTTILEQKLHELGATI